LDCRRIWMLGAERLLADRQRALEERPRPHKVALGLEQEGEAGEASRRIRMLGAERLLADRQRTLEERPRPHKVALGLEQEGEAGEASRRKPASNTEPKTRQCRALAYAPIKATPLRGAAKLPALTGATGAHA
jgi:hypothetical protein